MTIDTRAYAWCNLGPLAPGGGSSVAETHVQGSGVITCRGTINLAGVYRPAPGAVVELAYSDGQNWLARLPVRLRVLSRFANPLGGKTTIVSVGCDLAYLEDRKQPPASLTTRQANPDTPESVWRAAAPSIPASWLVGQILTALGLTAAGGIPLTNHYTRQEFDLSGGYVEELGKLAQSEGYAVRMNPAGLLQFIHKAPTDLGASTLLTEGDLIDLNPINTGDLPGDAVSAKYTSLKLRAPNNLDEDERQKRNWEREETIGTAQQHLHSYTVYSTVATGERQAKNAQGHPLFYVNDGFLTNIPLMETIYETKAGQAQERIAFIPKSTTLTTYDSKDRAVKRRTETWGLWGLAYSETYFYFDDKNLSAAAQQANKSGNTITREVSVEWSAAAPIRMSVGMQDAFSVLRGNGTGDILQSSYRETLYEKDEATGITKTITSSFVPYINTPFGSESVARLREQIDERNPGGVSTAKYADLVLIAQQLVEYGSEIRIRTEREFGVQRRPSEAERTASANQKAPTVEQQSMTVWAVGSATSQTHVVLSPPYVSDDRIVEAAGVYSVIKSDADQKALAYASLENRLLLGHRNGVGIQVLPEALPPVPMGLVYIRLNGCTGAYRINGTTWNIDPAGVTATTDALFWGAIDGTAADAWFPLPPGVNSLPGLSAVTTNASPRPANAINIPGGFSFTDPNLGSLFSSLPTGTTPTYAKTITPGVLLKPYHETISISAGSGSGMFCSTQPWIPQSVQLLAGSGSGVVVNLRQTLAGSLSGALVTPAWVSAATTFTPGAGQVLTPSATGVQWVSGASTFAPGLRSSDGLIVTASNTAAITILEVDTAIPYPSAIAISDGLGFLVDTLRVSISGFSHTQVGHVYILLVSPTGASSVLMAEVGWGVSASGLNITFDQAAASVVTGATSGTFRPGIPDYEVTLPEPAPAVGSTANLANFVNAQVFGTWSLYVADAYESESGSISGGWSLQIICKPDTTAVTNPGANWVSEATTFTPGARSA